MIKGRNKNSYKLAVAFVILIVIVLGLTTFLKGNKYPDYQQQSVGNYSNYTNRDLKISFQYPPSWYLNEKDLSILVTTYQTLIGENKRPNENQLRIDIDPISLCQPTIEQNLIYGGCGENQKVLNQILNKDIKQTSYGTLYKYLVKYPDNSEKIIYYFQNGDKILQISKSPDPSQFEEEFSRIVNSIKFL